MPNILLIILYLEGQHYNLQSLQYFSPSIFYAFTWPYFLKIVLSSRIINFKTHNNQRTRVLRWLGRENEENVARTKIDMAGLPPLLQESMNLTLKDKKKWIILNPPPPPICYCNHMANFIFSSVIILPFENMQCTYIYST